MKKGQVVEFPNSLLLSLLVYFVRHRGIALSRDRLLASVWGYDRTSLLTYQTHTVSVHVHWLRKLLEEDPEHPHLIQTVRGVGYRFLDEE